MMHQTIARSRASLACATSGPVPDMMKSWKLLWNCSSFNFNCSSGVKKQFQLIRRDQTNVKSELFIFLISDNHLLNYCQLRRCWNWMENLHLIHGTCSWYSCGNMLKFKGELSLVSDCLMVWLSTLKLVLLIVTP